MIPQLLTLEGVYSYREKQLIDFTSLTGGGIFGIFGSVGSGKSAILEAMTYALYGQIERLNQTDQRGYNMMNLQSNKMFIDFEFTHNRERYRFTVSAKRRKTNFETVTAPERQGYILTDGGWKPLSEQKIRGGVTAEPILGLSYEHFRRTVIIPQGQFQEFIQLKPARRTEMMESLFNLERFNLYGKTAALLGAVKSEKSFQAGRMEELEKFQQEDLNALLSELERFAKDLTTVSTEIEKGNTRLRTLNELQKMQEELQALQKQQESITSKLPKMEERLKRLNHYRNIYTNFHSLLNQKNSLAEERKRKEASYGQTEIQLKALNTEIGKVEETWDELKKNWENKESYLAQLRSLNAFLQIRELISETDILTEKQGHLKTYLQKYEKDEKQLTSERDQLLEKIQEKEKGLPDWDELEKTEDWFHLNDKLMSESENLTNQIEELKNEQSARLLQFSDLIDPEKTNPAHKEIVEQAQILIQKKQVQLESDQQSLQEDKIRTLHNEREKILQSNIKSLNSYMADFESLESQRKRLAQILTNKIFEINLKKSEFSSSSYKADERDKFFQDLKEARNRQKEIQENYEKLHELNRTLKKLKDDSKSSHKSYDEINLTMEKNKSARKTWEKDLSKEQLLSPPSDPEGEKIQLQNFLNSLEKEYPRQQKLRDDRIKRQQTLEMDLAAGLALLKEQDRRESDLEKSLLEAFSSTRQDSLEKVIKLLSQDLNIEKEEGEIESFNRERALLQDRLKNLNTKIADREYSPEKHKSLKDELSELESHKSGLLSRQGALQKQKEDLEKGLREKGILKKTFAETLIREENLKELTSLFKGKKFTEYIAAIYLQELCIRANERFFPLSGRTLELTFEDNAILVRDFLNEGKTRLVKTLSGGQTFQAALSLALALADQIGMGDDHFFFLDEGFGTLDRETLETVMMTLREISRDGRIIGLISHVDDLRQDLDVWLQVNRTAENGSRISSSWME
ncbi:MAG: hypothetical protein B6241_14805 [Spirochaetaceae bacterium 4572_59]|nr:MAG: hypothetical protein B6241_14805 [Spirochaetaceae bacterium 4572_59]